MSMVFLKFQIFKNLVKIWRKGNLPLMNRSFSLMVSCTDKWFYPELDYEMALFLTKLEAAGKSWKYKRTSEGLHFEVDGIVYESFQQYLKQHHGYVPKITLSEKRARKTIDLTAGINLKSPKTPNTTNKIHDSEILTPFKKKKRKKRVLKRRYQMILLLAHLAPLVYGV